MPDLEPERRMLINCTGKPNRKLTREAHTTHTVVLEVFRLYDCAEVSSTVIFLILDRIFLSFFIRG